MFLWYGSFIYLFLKKKGNLGFFFGLFIYLCYLFLEQKNHVGYDLFYFILLKKTTYFNIWSKIREMIP